MFDESITRLEAAARYLRKHRPRYERVGIDHKATTLVWRASQHRKRQRSYHNQ